MRYVVTVALVFLLSFGGFVRAAEAPKRLVVVGSALTEIIYLFNQGGTIVGVDDNSTYPQAAQQLPRVGVYNQLDVNAILRISPDEVLYTDEAGPPEVWKVLADAGIKTTKIDYQRKGMAHVLKLIDTFAVLLDVPQKGKEVRALVEAKLATLRKEQLLHPKRIRMVFVDEGENRELRVVGRNSPSHAMILLAGGVNSAAHFEGSQRLTVGNASQVSADIVLVPHDVVARRGGADELLKSPALAAMPAGVKGRVVVLPRDELLGFGPRTPNVARKIFEMIQSDL